MVEFVPPFVASEADGSVSVCVNISGPLDQNVTVLLSTEDNSAIGKSLRVTT